MIKVPQQFLEILPKDSLHCLDTTVKHVTTSLFLFPPIRIALVLLDLVLLQVQSPMLQDVNDIGGVGASLQ
jgi:hypothetical protein